MVTSCKTTQLAEVFRYIFFSFEGFSDGLWNLICYCKSFEDISTQVKGDTAYEQHVLAIAICEHCHKWLNTCMSRDCTSAISVDV